MSAGVTPRASWKMWTAVARGMPSLPGLVGQILQGGAEGVQLPGGTGRHTCQTARHLDRRSAGLYVLEGLIWQAEL